MRIGHVHLRTADIEPLRNLDAECAHLPGRPAEARTNRPKKSAGDVRPHAGLIAREPSQTDARVAILRLTAEGERRLARSFHAHATERKRLRAMVTRLAN